MSEAPVLKFPNKMKIQLMNPMVMLRQRPWSNCSIISEMICFLIRVSWSFQNLIKAFMLDSGIKE